MGSPPSAPTSPRFARTAAQHAGPIFTGCAILLYAVGVVSTVGQIRATDLDVGRVMTLIPLETHLRNGVGIVASPTFLIVCGTYLLMYLTARNKVREARDDPQPDRSSTRGWWDRRVYWVPVGLVGLWIAFTSPWPFIILIVIIGASWVAPFVLPRRLGPPWNSRTAEVYVLSGVAALVLISFLDAYFRSDPFPTATAVTADRRVTGPLIVSGDALIYLAPSRSSDLYAGVATDQILSLHTRPKKRVEEPSVLNLLGIDWPHRNS